MGLMGLVAVAVTSAATPVIAQTVRPGSGVSADRTVHPILRTPVPISVDAVLDEPIWSAAEVIGIGYEWLPGDNTPAPVQTEVRFAYDDDFFYISFVALDPNPREIRAHVRDRDVAFTDDHVLFMLDTFNDARRAFQFRVNPLGVQMDASFSEAEGFEDWSWDTIWDSAGRITEDGYVVEAAVPFSSLRFPRTGDAQTWGLVPERYYPRNVRHRLRSSPVDRGRSTILDQGDRIQGLQGITPGRNIEFDPTFTSVRTDAIAPGGLFDSPPQTDLLKGDAENDLGLTAKWGITPNLIFNGTLNPDFSQVEADVAQLAVNTRFALYFPERRPFFLEGADFFVTPLNAVFTRTIVNPTLGLKLTGKQGRHAFGAFAARDRITNLLFPGNQGSYSDQLDSEVTTGVLRHRYDLGRNSTFGLMFVGREGQDYHNRVFGGDGFLRLTDAKTLNFQLLGSSTSYPDSAAVRNGQSLDDLSSGALYLRMDSVGRDWLYMLGYEDVGRDFRADAGFVPRVDYRAYNGYVLRQYWGSADSWYTRVQTGIGVTRLEFRDRDASDANVRFHVTYFGPLQSFFRMNIPYTWEYYAGRHYEFVNPNASLQLQPSAKITLGIASHFGGAIDLANAREARQLVLAPSVGFYPGRRLEVDISHVYQRLEADSARLFTAHLPQLRMLYHLNVRTYVRVVVQYQKVDRNTGNYLSPVDPESESLFTQLLFSYKLNPQTVLFLGYSDNSAGGDFGATLGTVDLTRTDRTFFLKLGYALVL